MSGWAAEALLASSLLAIAVLLLRRPVARLFGARAAYALWLAPLARMLLPPLPEGGPLPEIIIFTAPGGHAAATVATGIAWRDALVGLWLAGAAVFLLFQIFQHHRFLARAIAAGRRLPAAATGPELIESSAVAGPIATGVIRQRIILPAGFAERLTAGQQQLALAHEQLHHRRGDLLSLAVSTVVLALHWFNPLAHFAHRAFRRDLEAACDAELVERIGPAEREDYARAIIGCAAAPVPRAICTLTPIDDLKRRLTMLQHTHGKIARVIGFGCAATLAVAGLGLGTGASAQEPAEKVEKVEKRVIIREGNGSSEDRISKDLEAKIRKCDGQAIEANAETGASDKKQRTRIVICGKGNATEVAAKLEKALQRIEGEDEMSPENKAQILAQLRAKIAELRAR